MKQKELAGLLGDGRAEPSGAAGLLSDAQQQQPIAPSQFAEALADWMHAHHKLKLSAGRKPEMLPGLLGQTRLRTNKFRLRRDSKSPDMEALMGDLFCSVKRRWRGFLDIFLCLTVFPAWMMVIKFTLEPSKAPRRAE